MISYEKKKTLIFIFMTVGIWTTVVPATISELLNKYLKDTLFQGDENEGGDYRMPHVRRFVNEVGYEVPEEYKVKAQDIVPQKRKSSDDEKKKTEEENGISKKQGGHEKDKLQNKPKTGKKKKDAMKGPPKNTNVYLRVLLCTSDFIEDERQVDELLKPFVENINTQYPYLYFPGKVELRQTVRYPADTKEESNEWSEKTQWPLMWRGNVAALPTLIDQREQQQALKYLKIVARMAVDEAQNSTANRIPIAALMVDPVKDRIIAKGFDERSGKKPLQHSAMVIIENAAKWRKEAEKSASEELKRIIEESQEGSVQVDIETRKKLFEQNNQEELFGYLCRGFHVYMTHEPCAMCSMGLLHSRVTRLVYIVSKLETGGIDPKSEGSLCIHDQESLNWQYEAWQYVPGAIANTATTTVLNEDREENDNEHENETKGDSILGLTKDEKDLLFGNKKGGDDDLKTGFEAIQDPRFHV